MKGIDELETMDKRVKLAGEDEMATMFDPNTHPKPPSKGEEAVTLAGEEVDIMADTPAIDDDFLDF